MALELELYILNTMYQRIAIVDNFESLIWTERASALGDFELIMASTMENRQKLPAGTLLGLNMSDRIMVLETFADGENSEGEQTLTLKGRDLEKILDERVAATTTDDPSWIITDKPADIARKIFHDICIAGTFNTGDIISGITEGTFYPEDTIVEPDDEITYSIEVMSVYQALVNLCNPYAMGFRLVRDRTSNSPTLYFDIYMGSDRTTLQSDLPAVVFSEELDTLQSPNEITSIALFKNVAYVFSPAGKEVVYPLDVDSSISGFERRALWINMTDLAADDPDASAKMIQKGKEELYKNRQLSAFDGELNQYSSYVYGQDYNLNDLVEMQNRDGVRNQMRVTEQIFVSDEQGVRSYPTLALQTFITPGSWLARPAEQVWVDVPDSEHWGDLP